MAEKVRYFCSDCGYESAKWQGQCPSCKAWNSFAEAPETKGRLSKKASAAGSSRASGLYGRGFRGMRQRPMRIDEISLLEEDRLPTGYGELDRVLGGGMVVGSLVLLGGDPGIGKSTILLSVARNLAAESGKSVLYVSGEESLRQIKLRAMRLAEIRGDLRFLCETNIENILETVLAEGEGEGKPDLLIIDSIQTMFTESVSAAPGSLSQIRESAAALLRMAKENAVSVFIVGHVTKDGSVAGPKVLEHMVDVVLYFEGESQGSLRILHGRKNRFGSTNEIAVFEMSGRGLREVQNPSELLLSGRPAGSPGSVVTCGMEGTRPLLIEIQGLAVPTSFGIPRRTANGLDYNRMNLLLAIIERRIGLELSKYDAYLNIAGGIRVSEPSSDLAVILAIISSMRNLAFPEDAMVFGEVGLSGEVRAVSNAAMRIEEAVRLGFRQIVLPAYHVERFEGLRQRGAELLPVRSIREALGILRKS